MAMQDTDYLAMLQRKLGDQSDTGNPSPTSNSPAMPNYSSQVQSYLKQLQQAPQISDYHPSVGRRIGGIFRGLDAGPAAEDQYLQAPYQRQVQDYMTKLGATKEGFEVPSEMALKGMQYTEAGQRALAEAARAKQEQATAALRQYQTTPEYTSQRFGYQPQSLDEKLQLDQAMHPVRPPTAPHPTAAGDSILMPDGKGGWNIQRNPNPRPFAGRETEQEREKFYKFKKDFDSKNPEKPLTANEYATAKKTATATVMSNPKYKDVQQSIAAGQIETKPGTGIFGRQSKEQNKLYDDFLDDVEKETHRILGKKNPSAADYSGKVGKYSISSEDDDTESDEENNDEDNQ